MASPERNQLPSVSRSEQDVLVQSFDETYRVLAVAMLGMYNGALQNLNLDASGNLKVAVTGGSSGGDLSTAAKGSTTAGSPTSTNAGTDRQPLDVTLRDTSGNPVSVGGGTQYADGATAATPTGGQINWNEAGTQRAVSATKPLPVDVKTASIAVTQGTASNLKVDLSGTGANATALKVDGSAVTQPVSGTVAVSNASFPVTDNSGSLTVDAPVGTPVFVRLSDGSSAIATLPVSLSSVPTHAVTGSGTFTTKETRSTTPAQTSVSVTNANTSVLASNANRLGATIYNEGSATCYLKLGATASTTSYSVQIASGGYYEVPFNYTGAIDAITSASTAQLRITEIA